MHGFRWKFMAPSSSHVKNSLTERKWDTVETLYSMIPYTMVFDITRWPHGPQNLQRLIRTLIVLLGFLIKQTRVICCLLPMPSTLNEPTCDPLPTSVNNDGRTDYLRLSHLTALPTGVSDHLRCIHKGLTAFSVKEFLPAVFKILLNHFINFHTAVFCQGFGDMGTDDPYHWKIWGHW